MNVYVIYFDPSDYPKQFVLRKWQISGDGLKATQEPEIVTPKLDKARAALPPNLMQVPRMKGDDPVIVECWI